MYSIVSLALAGLLSCSLVAGVPVDTAHTPDSVQNTQIANPFTSYDTVEAAQTAIGDALPVPTVMPEGYTLSHISVIADQSLMQLVYQNGDKRLTYRVCKNQGDIAGDFNTYDTTQTVTVGDVQVNCRGNGESVSVASWTANSLQFSLQSSVGLSVSTLKDVISSIS